jgi:EpsD family peptidyl-prolyl cis-trans isomerase
MNFTCDEQTFHRTGRLTTHLVVLAVIGAFALAAAGCGAKKDKPASQTAAKVNKEEITVHQINYVLQQQRGIAPEQAAAASKLALERLIDQELALQKAQELKIDRDPRVVQQIEAARREIIARSYVEKIATGAPQPSAEEIGKYYADKPARFKERRVYNLQEVLVEAKPEQLATLKAKLEESKDIGAFIAYLKANNIKHGGNQAMRTPEQLPENVLDRLAKMKDGEAMFTPIRNGAQVIVIASSRAQPVDEAQARTSIEQLLVNDRKRRLVEDDLKSLRTAAQIEYVGDYAKDAGKPTQTLTEAPAAEPLVPGSAASGTEPAAGVADPDQKGMK